MVLSITICLSLEEKKENFLLFVLPEIFLRGWYSMKKSGIAILGIFSILVMVVAISGCTSTQTYSGNGISFQYPDDWSQFTPDTASADKVVSLQANKGSYSMLGVYVYDAEGGGLNDWKSVQRASLSAANTIISEQSVQIAGVTGNRLDYNMVPTGQQVDIIFVKNGKTYNLIFTTGSINAINSDINTIVNSFKTT